MGQPPQEQDRSRQQQEEPSADQCRLSCPPLQLEGIPVGDVVPDDEIRSVMLDMSGVMRELGLRELEEEELAARYPCREPGPLWCLRSRRTSAC